MFCQFPLFPLLIGRGMKKLDRLFFHIFSKCFSTTLYCHLGLVCSWVGLAISLLIVITKILLRLMTLIGRTLKDNNMAIVFLCTFQLWWPMNIATTSNSYIEMKHQSIFLSQTLRLPLGPRFSGK